MKPYLKSISVILLIGVGIWVFGCSGGDDALDELGYRYWIETVNVKDRGALTSDIDVIHGCDNNLTNDGSDHDGEDPLTKATMDITFKADPNDANSTDLFIYKIDTEYDLIEWHHDTNATEPVPQIPDNSYDVAVRIPAKGTVTPPSFDLLSTTDKDIYVDHLDGVDNAVLVSAIFQVTVVAYGTYTPQNVSEDMIMEYSFTINVRNFADDSCQQEEEE